MMQLVVVLSTFKYTNNIAHLKLNYVIMGFTPSWGYTLIYVSEKVSSLFFTYSYFTHITFSQGYPLHSIYVRKSPASIFYIQPIFDTFLLDQPSGYPSLSIYVRKNILNDDSQPFLGIPKRKWLFFIWLIWTICTKKDPSFFKPESFSFIIPKCNYPYNASYSLSKPLG